MLDCGLEDGYSFEMQCKLVKVLFFHYIYIDLFGRYFYVKQIILEVVLFREESGLWLSCMQGWQCQTAWEGA